jgi:FlaA1/EpsC-like NDP-sugar epimerase
MNFLYKTVGQPTPLKRTIFFVIADGVIFLVSIYLSYAFKFGLYLDNPYLVPNIITKTIILFFIIKYSIFFKVRLYQFTWQYVGLNDLYNLLKANTFSLFILFMLYFIGRNNILYGLPKSVIVSDYFISFILAGFLRISKRLYIEIFNPARSYRGKNTLIIGAGSVGEMILRDLRKNNFHNYYPLGYLDNDKKKIGYYIHNIPVLGDISILESMVKKFEVEALIITDENLSYRDIQNMFKRARKIGIDDIKIVPHLYSFTDLEVTVKRLEDIRIEDLINRQEIRIDVKEIKDFINNKVILVTGAAGSIGTEIVRQISLFNPKNIILFEIDETEVFFLERELKEKFPEISEIFISVVGDVRDSEKVAKIFREFQPEIVFHTAAYKHVPLMENNPEEAIKVNIIGTYNLCLSALDYGVQKFINISTDKAVKPNSVMGATKRFGEYVAKAFNTKNKTQFVSVRFGNVLGSRGSVIPIFLEQLRKGGPITITHKDMKRYFMTIPEAVSLVLEASLIGQGGEIMVLDMGEPVSIQQLAEELIILHGLTPNKDVDIVYTGIRPGEKIFEEILTAEEGSSQTKHERIFIAKMSGNLNLKEVKKSLDDINKLIKNNTRNDTYKNWLYNQINQQIRIEKL